MKKQMINLIPGPTSVEDRILKKMAMNYGSGDLDPEFLQLYNKTEKKLQQILGTKNQIIIQTGEGMWGLWGALKSTIIPGDKIVAVCNGIFSYGIADMAETLGADVLRVNLDYNQTLNSTEPLAAAVKKHKPLMITAVHCETPTGTLNSLNLIAEVKKEFNVPLLCVDTVASSGGCLVEVDQNLVDLSLNGSQKALSAPPSMSFVSVSPKAWERIEQVNYSGYDAFLPFKNAQREFYFPNTPYWHGMAALEEAATILIEEGLENVYERHKKCMEFCHKRLNEMNLEIFPENKTICAPTVTAVKLPENQTWEQFNRLCLEKGLWITGSYGKLSGHIFRIGHMGNQARLELLKAGLDIIETIIKK